MWFFTVTCSCCPYLYFGSPIMWVTYLGSWMTTCLGKSCLFGLPRVPFVNCCQFMYLVISLLVLRAGYGIWLYQFLMSAYRFTFEFDMVFCFGIRLAPYAVFSTLTHWTCWKWSPYKHRVCPSVRPPARPSFRSQFMNVRLTLVILEFR